MHAELSDIVVMTPPTLTAAVAIILLFPSLEYTIVFVFIMKVLFCFLM